MQTLSNTPVVYERRGIRWLAFPDFAAEGAYAAATLRPGGVTPGPRGSLNLSYAVGDEPARVDENWRRAAAALEIDPASVVTAQQIHGQRVARVTAASAGYQPAGGRLSADGLVTDQPGVILCLRFADCVPIFAFDPVRRAVGIAHAGWRGTLAGIAGVLVQAFATEFGTQPRDLRVAIGPSIGPCCYVVGADLAARFATTCSTLENVWLRGAAETRLNLWEANRQQLVASGVDPDRLSVSAICTSCQVEDYFSHRAQQGQAGRFIGAIWIR
ncbi:MAG TPA: peptidoglycan editing factor PgeF [Chloroflexota bacterium]